MHCEYASKSLVLVLQNAELKDMIPILFSSQERRDRFSCFLKSNFNQAQLTFNNTGQKGHLKSLKALMRKLFEFCLNSQNSDCEKFIHSFIHKDIILPGIETLKKLE